MNYEYRAVILAMPASIEGEPYLLGYGPVSSISETFATEAEYKANQGAFEWAMPGGGVILKERRVVPDGDWELAT